MTYPWLILQGEVHLLRYSVADWLVTGDKPFGTIVVSLHHLLGSAAECSSEGVDTGLEGRVEIGGSAKGNNCKTGSDNRNSSNDDTIDNRGAGLYLESGIRDWGCHSQSSKSRDERN